jgi:hypothetical protein
MYISDMVEIFHILLGAVLALSGALLVNYLNTKREKKQLSLELKSEAVATCSKIVFAYNRMELYTLQSMALYRIYDLNKNIEIKVLGDTFLERSLDASFEFGNYKTELLQCLVELYNYMPESDIVFLKQKYDSMQNIVPREHNYFANCKTDLEVSQLREKGIGEMRAYIKTTSCYLIMEDIKKRLSPHV